MISKLEILPNEILLNIFCYLSWDEILISLWSLNERFNSLIYLIFSNNENGIIFNKSGLSYKIFSSILLPLIFNSSSSISSNIKYIHFDGNKSIPFDFIYQCIFSNNDQQKISFPNLKSLYITRCFLTQPIIQTLSVLIQYHLNQLTLTFHEDMFEGADYTRVTSLTIFDIATINGMFTQLLSQIFSGQCQLTSLHLDMTKLRYAIHECLKSYSSNLPLKTNSDGFQSYCVSLRRLYIQLKYTCFLEHLIDHVPNLEQLSTVFPKLQRDNKFYDSNSERPILSNESWVNKVPKLKCFILKSSIDNDFEFVYLKWLLNNLNHIRKLKIYLRSPTIWRPDQLIWKYFIDGNFIRQYCLPDEIINLKSFHFYIGRTYQLSLDDIENTINSFKNHPFFILHQWTNIKCLYDKNESYQRIFSSNFNKAQLSDSLFTQPYRYDWSNTRRIWFVFDPSLYLFLDQLDKQCPNVSSIAIHTGYYFSQLVLVKKNTLTDRDKVRAKIFAHLLSMPVQLKHLFVKKFEWLLYVIHYAADELRKNALTTIQYAEFGIPSCNIGRNESIHIGKNLVSILSTYMPHLHTLQLWRPDDFPWTSHDHVTVFEQDLSQLFDQLKEFIFVDICGIIRREKVEPYRLMAQTRFPNSRIDVQLTRFRLWI
ncbi:unnamed protein product [Rotaria sp. Silwood2]|nr:unnamed protein product [Rotaria sp. Silwood2]